LAGLLDVFIGAIVGEQQESRYRFALNKPATTLRDRQRHPVKPPSTTDTASTSTPRHPIARDYRTRKPIKKYSTKKAAHKPLDHLKTKKFMAHY
jgi:hypothetical protein